MPYAKSVPSKTGIHGARPDPGDLFDCMASLLRFLVAMQKHSQNSNLYLVLMARKDDKESSSGLSSMLLYHADIIIHGAITILW